jgi:IclR family acetate operon transcriptional repressor
MENRGLAKGSQMIEALAVANSPLSLGQLATIAGLGKASALRLLSTLTATGFARRDPAGPYLPARRFEPQSASLLRVERLRAAAKPELARLNQDLAETVTLAALFEDHIRVVDFIESPRQIRLSTYQNRILPPYASSLGKAIAAFLPPAAFQELLHVYGVYPFTPRTIVDPVQLRAEMERTRSRGYSFEYEESVPGGCCFGAPIRMGSDPVQAAVSVSMPTSRFNDKLEKTISRLVIEMARRISKRLSQETQP